MSEATAPIDEDDALLAELAQQDMALARHVHAQALATTDPDTLNGLVRSAQRLSRSIRQTLALKARRQREKAAAARKPAPWPPAHEPSAPRTRYGVLDDMADLEVAATERIRAEYDPSEAEAIEDDLADLVSEIWQTDGFPDLPLDEQVDALMASIRKAFVFEAAPEPAPPAPPYNGRLAPPMDLPSWIDEDSS